MGLNWNDLKVALAIAEAGSLSRGASVLGIDQSTAGRRLSTLEADMGTILFTRSKTGFAPTQAGREVIERAREVALRIDRLTDDLSEDANGPVGSVRLIGNGWMLERLAETIVPGFLDAHPLIDLRLMSFEPRTPPLSDATVALWFEMPPRTGEFSIKLGKVPYALYVKKGLDPDDLGWVSFFSDDTSRSAPVRAWEKMRGQGERRLRLTATDARMLLSAVRSGIGKGILPMCLAEADPTLERVTETPHDIMRTANLHAHPDTVQTHRVQAVIKCLRESFDAVFTKV